MENNVVKESTNERIILSSLIHNEEYARKVVVFLKSEYFQETGQRLLFETIRNHINEYTSIPNPVEISVTLKNNQDINADETKQALEELESVLEIKDEAPKTEWLMKTTEEWCKNQAVFNAIQKSIAIYQGEDSKLTTDAIPDLLKDAISVCFDNKIGLDFFDDAESRYDFYTTPENKIPFHLQVLNDVTCGGITTKTLNLLVSGTNVGKTLGLIDMAAGYVKAGYDVLYISAEMREELIMQRFDANVLKVPVNDVASIGKERFLTRVETLRQKSYGKFRVKEFPPGAASTVHIRNVMNEMRLKTGFQPKVVIVDYLQIIGSYRMKLGAVGSYYYYKSVAEELREMAVEFDIAVWSAAQFNRGGMSDTDAGMSDVAESVGIMFTVDGAWSLTRTDELDSVNQIQWKQMKSRYANKAVRMRFVTGVDIERQTFYDVVQSEQDNVANEAQRGAAPPPRERHGDDRRTVSEEVLLTKFKKGGQKSNRFNDMR